MNRADFAILNEQVHGKELVYLDNAATSQKPQQVINAIVEAYTHWNSNIHRGVHHLSQVATRLSMRRAQRRSSSPKAQRTALTPWRFHLDNGQWTMDNGPLVRAMRLL